MSLITCCPACGTMFKVVPDQLRISEGWVRCGHCAEVFDAAAQLQDQNSDGAALLRPAVEQAPDAVPRAHATLPEPEPQSASQVGPKSESESHPEPEPAPDSVPDPKLHSLPDSRSDRETVLVAPALQLPQSAAPDYHSYPPFELPRNEYEDFAPWPGPVDSADPLDLPGPLSRPADSALESSLNDVSFVRQARRRAFWRSSGMRITLAAAAPALAVLLGLQFAVQERDRVAASVPVLRPLLEALCQPLDCTVGPPRQIEAILIDSSTFNRLRGDAYRLAFTLKNQAPLAVAMPSIELTLTDSQDQPLVRRVLTPSELGATAGVIGGVSEWSGTLAFGLSPGNPGGRVAGYRMLAFYP